MKQTQWKINEENQTVCLQLHQCAELRYRKLNVPVWRQEPGMDSNRYYKGPFVRYEDLPDDLAKAFRRWQILAQIPFLDGSYLHDFEDFMARCGRGFNGDFSAIVEQYR